MPGGTRGYTNKGKSNYRGRTGYGRKKTQRFNPRNIVAGGDALADLKKCHYHEWNVINNGAAGALAEAQLGLNPTASKVIEVIPTAHSSDTNMLMLMNCPIRFKTTTNDTNTGYKLVSGKKAYARFLDADLTFSAVGNNVAGSGIQSPPIDVDLSVVLLNGSYDYALNNKAVAIHSNDVDSMGLKRCYNIYHKRFSVSCNSGQVYKFKVFKEFNRSISRSGVGANPDAHAMQTNPDSEATGSESVDHQRLALIIKTKKNTAQSLSNLNIQGYTKWCFYEQ